MNDFKIGDKVKFKGSDEFIGYVSNVFKGHLFLIDDFEIDVHFKGKPTILNASELEKYDE